MDHNELDIKLRTLTKSEENHKVDPNTSPVYEQLEQININGTQAYIFDSGSVLKEENFTINKHSRFIDVPMHVHTFIELNYVYSGEYTQIINDHQVTLKEGQVCIVDTSIPHAALTTNENDIIINILMRKEYFSTSFLSRLSSKGIISQFLTNAVSDKKKHDNYIIFNSENNRKLPNLIKELLCEYYDKSLYYHEIIDCYMILIFTELLKVFQYDANKSHKDGNATIIDILQYLEDNFLTCTLASTAKHFNFHPNYLSSLIKKSTNKSFKELVQIQRLTRSSVLLANSNIPIYEIANEIGYQNLNFFYKKFKDFFGMTPNDYREKQRL